jgi:hypothetical protein
MKSNDRSFVLFIVFSLLIMKLRRLVFELILIMHSLNICTRYFDKLETNFE